MNRFAIVLFGAALVTFAACNGGGSTAPSLSTGTASPTIVPSSVPATMMPTAAPSSGPTTLAPNYMPFNRYPIYEGGDPNATYSSTGAGYVRFYDTEAELEVRLAVGQLPQSCATPIVGNIGDYILNSAQLVVPNETRNQAMTRLNGQFQTYSLTKDVLGNIYVDAYYTKNNSKVCVTPYLLMKSQVAAGDSWTYTDINGSTQVAKVVAVGQTMTFRVTGTGPYGGQTVGPYSNVAVVTYGSTLTLYFAASLGPVASMNTVASPYMPLQMTMCKIDPGPVAP